MSSGYSPISGILFSNRITEAFYGRAEDDVAFAHGHTYGGNPLSCAAAIASVSEIKERDLLRNTRDSKVDVVKRLRELDSLGCLGDIRGKGLFLSESSS